MSRIKLLITNVGFFGGLKVLSSLFPLFILPYVTGQLKGADEFGVYDMFMVLSGLSAGVALMGIQDSMFRQYHLKKDEIYRKKVTTTGFVIVITSSIVVCGIIFILKGFIQGLFFDDSKYFSVIYFAAIYVVIKNVMNVSVHPSRLLNNKKHLLIHTLMNAVVYYAFVIILLKYSYGLFSLVYAHFTTALSIIGLFLFINRKSFFPLLFSKAIAKQLLKVGLPLMPIFIIYWANNSVVRILIMKYLGATDLGVFAIGSKYASVSTFIQMAFAGGWSYFTFSTMNDSDQVKLKTRIFETLLFVIVLGYIFITPLAPIFFETVFKGDYARGYTVFGQLFLSPLFLVLYQIIANQFTIAGKSYFSLISLSIGFVLSFIIAIAVLENGYGIDLVSYSIPISYLISILIAYYFAKKQNIFDLKVGSFVSFGFILIVNLILQFEHSLYTYLFFIPLTILYLFLNKKLVLDLVFQVKKIMPQKD